MREAIKQEIIAILEQSDMQLSEEKINKAVDMFMESDYVGEVMNNELINIIDELME